MPYPDRTMPLPDFASLHPTLRSVQTRPLLVMRLDVSPILAVGATPGAQRRVGIVAGGEFGGDRLSGTVLEGGSDWQSIRTDGSVGLDVRLVLRTADGALVTMKYTGLRHGPADVLQRVDRGEDVDPATYYFRIQATFETADPRLDFINRVLAVGVGQRQPGGPVYSLFEVL